MIYFSFKEWFVLLEVKKPYDIALEIVKKNGGDENTLKKFSDLLPIDLRDRNKILALIVFYGLHHEVNANNDVSKADNKPFMDQLKTDMTNYLSLVNQNLMPKLSVDDNHQIQVHDATPATTINTNYNSYLKWTEIIHGKIAERTRKEKLSNIELDFSDMKVVAKNSEGTITVYDAHGVEKCIALGKGQEFCISQPVNTMWQSYRDTKKSSFYFVYDNTRNDRLHIVVVDATIHGIELTDIPNQTGTIGNPENSNISLSGNEGVNAYFNYLNKQGVVGLDGETNIRKIFLNIPYSPEEEKEKEMLTHPKESLEEFVNLGYELMSKYIGRGHSLSNEQFDYIYEHYPTLLKQYVSTGVKLNDYQLKIIAESKGKYKDYIENYLHNRLISDQNHDDFDEKEYELLKSKNLLGKENKILSQKKLIFWMRCDIEKAKNILETDQNENGFYDIAMHVNNQLAFSYLLASLDKEFIDKHANKFCYMRSAYASSFAKKDIIFKKCGFDFLRLLAKSENDTHANYGKDIASAVVSEALSIAIKNFKTDNFDDLIGLFKGKFFPNENCLRQYIEVNKNFVEMATQISADSLEIYIYMKSLINEYDVLAVAQKCDDDVINSAVNKYFRSEFCDGYEFSKAFFYSEKFRKFVIRALKNAKLKLDNYHVDNLLKIIFYAFSDKEKEINNLKEEFLSLPDENEIEKWINNKITNYFINENKYMSFRKIDDSLALQLFKTFIEYDEETRKKYNFNYNFLPFMEGNKINFIDNVLKLENCNELCLNMLKLIAKNYIQELFITKDSSLIEESKIVLEKFKSINLQSSNVLEQAVKEVQFYYANFVINDFCPIIFKILSNTTDGVYDLFPKVLGVLLAVSSENFIKKFESIFDPDDLQSMYRRFFDYSCSRAVNIHSHKIYSLKSKNTSTFINNIIENFSDYVTGDLFLDIMFKFFVSLNILNTISDGMDQETKNKRNSENMEYIDKWRRFKNFFLAKGKKFKQKYEELLKYRSVQSRIELSDFNIETF